MGRHLVVAQGARADDMKGSYEPKPQNPELGKPERLKPAEPAPDEQNWEAVPGR